MTALIGRASHIIKLVPWLESHARRGSMSSHLEHKKFLRRARILKLGQPL